MTATDPLIEKKTTQEGAQIPAESAVKDIVKAPFSLSNLQTAMKAYPKGIPPVSPMTNQKPPGMVSFPPFKPFNPMDLVRKDPVINTKRDVPVTTIYGEKTVIPAGEALAPHIMTGNKVVLQDERPYVVKMNQYQNIKGQSVSWEKKPFAPELSQTTEVIRGVRDSKRTQDELKQYTDLGVTPEVAQQILSETGNDVLEPKFSQHTLPGGDNYREILLTAPRSGMTQKAFANLVQRMDKLRVYKKQYEDTGQDVPEQLEKDLNLAIKTIKEEQAKGFTEYHSSHWDEPNVLTHIRMNDRTTSDGETVAFLEELQSDWATAGRKHGFMDEETVRKARQVLAVMDKQLDDFNDKLQKKYGRTEWVISATGREMMELEELRRERASILDDLDDELDKAPSHPLLKNWQELAIKRALKDAVDSGAQYFAWTTGQQQADRWDLSKYVKRIQWVPATEFGPDLTHVSVEVPRQKDIMFAVNKKIGKITGGSFLGKDLDQVVPRKIADQILHEDRGVVEKDGLHVGGEWAYHLYDEQVPNIVKSLTGRPIETIDFGEGKQKAIMLTADVVRKIRGLLPQVKAPTRKIPVLTGEPK